MPGKRKTTNTLLDQKFFIKFFRQKGKCQLLSKAKRQKATNMTIEELAPLMLKAKILGQENEFFAKYVFTVDIFTYKWLLEELGESDKYRHNAA